MYIHLYIKKNSKRKIIRDNSAYTNKKIKMYTYTNKHLQEHTHKDKNIKICMQRNKQKISKHTRTQTITKDTNGQTNKNTNAQK